MPELFLENGEFLGNVKDNDISYMDIRPVAPPLMNANLNLSLSYDAAKHLVAEMRKVIPEPVLSEVSWIIKGVPTKEQEQEIKDLYQSGKLAGFDFSTDVEKGETKVTVLAKVSYPE